jgi:hypothetical protein
VAPGPLIGTGAIPSLRFITSALPWPEGRRPPVGQQWLDVDGRRVAWGAVENGRWLMDWPGLGTYRFGPFGDVEVFPAPGADPAALQDSFVRGVLPVVFVAREHEALHGSAVEVGGRVAAFCARSGVGKSSLALGLAAHGGFHWADDTVLLTRDATASTMCLPFPPRVDADAVGALSLDGINVSRAAPGDTATVAALFVLERDTSLEPSVPVIEALAPAALFERLLAHSHPFDLGGPERRRRMLERLMAVAEEVPGARLRFAPSLTALPILVEAVARHIDAS